MTIVWIRVYWRAGLVTQQTRGIHPKLFQCWHTVFDAGPALKQHWVNFPRVCWVHYRNSFTLASNLNCKPQLSLFLMYIFSIKETGNQLSLFLAAHARGKFTTISHLLVVHSSMSMNISSSLFEEYYVKVLIRSKVCACWKWRGFHRHFRYSSQFHGIWVFR